MPNLSINFKEILAHAQGNFGEQNSVLELYIIIIDYCIIIIIIIIIKACCDQFTADLLCYIYNESLLEGCGKEENVEGTGAGTNSYSTRL
jgi:hypothetical protein